MSCGLRCVGTRRGIIANRKRVSTEVVRCRKCEFDDKERYVVVTAYEDGDVEVRCDGGCSACKYRRTDSRESLGSSKLPMTLR